MQLIYQKSGLFLQISCQIFQNEHAKAIKNEKNDVLFYGMAYVIKSEKSESEKATYWMQSHRFFKKSGLFQQISCQVFQNEHEKDVL